MADQGLMSEWEQYFEELSTFICSLDRGRIAYANEGYTEYVLERLSTCINTIARIVDNIQSSMDTVELEEDEFEAADNYLVLLSQLLDCVREISVEWQVHFDHLQVNNYSPPYPVKGHFSCLQVDPLRDLPGQSSI